MPDFILSSAEAKALVAFLHQRSALLPPVLLALKNRLERELQASDATYTLPSASASASASASQVSDPTHMDQEANRVSYYSQIRDYGANSSKEETREASETISRKQC